jgi:hypothetical protein
MEPVLMRRRGLSGFGTGMRPLAKRTIRTRMNLAQEMPMFYKRYHL